MRRDRRHRRGRTSAVRRRWCAALKPGAAGGREELLDLHRQGAQRGVLDAADGGACSRAQPESDCDGFVVIEDERWQVCADGQSVSPVGPCRCVDGIAEGAEPVHIAPHRAFRDLEAFGELLPQHATTDGSEGARAGGALGRSDRSSPSQIATCCGPILSAMVSTVVLVINDPLQKPRNTTFNPTDFPEPTVDPTVNGWNSKSSKLATATPRPSCSVTAGRSMPSRGVTRCPLLPQRAIT